MRKIFILLFSITFSLDMFFAEPRLVVQTGHDGTVSDVKYSADGKYLFSTDDMQIKIWEVESGHLIRTITKGKEHGENAAFSPAGKFCVYTIGGVLKACDIENGKETIVDSSLDKSTSHFMTFASDGSVFAVVADYSTIRVYTTRTLRLAYSLSDSRFGQYQNMDFSDDSRYLGVSADLRSGNKVLSHALLWDLNSRRVHSAIDMGEYLEYTDISPDGKYIACESDKGLVIADIRKSSVITRIAIELIHNICFSSDSTKIYVACHSGIGVYEISTGRKVSFFKDLDADSIDFTPDGQIFAAGWNGGIKLYLAYDGSLVKTIKGTSDIRYWQYIKGIDSIGVEAGNWNWALFDREGKNFSLQCNKANAVIFESGIWYTTLVKKSYSPKLYDFESGTELQEWGTVKYGRPIKGSNEKMLALRTGKTVSVYDVSAKKLLRKYTTSDYCISEAFSPSMGFLYSSIPYSRSGKTEIVKISTGEKFTTKNGTGGLAFSPDDRYCAMDNNTESGKYDIIIYNTSDWSVSRTLSAKTGFYSPLCFSQDGKYLLTRPLDAANVSVYELSTGREILHLPVLYEAVYSADGSRIIGQTYDKIIRTYSAKAGELLTSLCVDENGDYFIYTPEGYFTGSPDGINKFVHVVDGLEVTDLGQMAETLYRPDLVAAKLRGEDISEKVALDGVGAGASKGGSVLEQIVSTGEPPLVRFVNPPASSASRDATVTFTAEDQGGGIGAVYLSLNGKVIQIAEGSRKFALVGGDAKAVQSGGGKTVTYSHTLSLQNGENVIEAYATNSAGKIESRRALTKITWRGATQKPSLHVLAVGVNKYRDRSLWLQYSVPDAQSVSKSFGGQKSSLYQDIHTYELLDGDVTKESLSAKFAELSGKVRSDDVFILFIAGHGTTSQKTGDYYFIPSNFRYTDSDAILTQGISKGDILGYMSAISAGKTLIMLDTCNSGAFTNGAAARGFAEKTALERLVRSTGQAVLTAASEEQSAMEGYNGHGIFTYVLLEALSGKADSNSDGYTTLTELAAYIEEQVPELSYKKWGYEQVPMKELKKQDFPIIGK